LLTIVGLGILCFGLGSRALMSGAVPSTGDDPLRLETSSIELSTGSGVATLSAHGMAPGDTAAAVMTIANSSRAPMAYGMSIALVSAGGAALARGLVLTIRTVGSSCADFNGTTLFDGPLDEAAIGSEADGRLLPAATAEILCFRVALPIETGDSLQDAATTVTLAFRAGSTAAIR
jgi:hypothetical protein